MRISLNWLKELVDINMTPEELADLLTMAGFEVEDIEDRRTWADGVVVGKVLKCEPHPNADKLRVCQVDIGADAPSNIVCGAPNVKADLYVPVATLGTYLPKVDLKIKPAKLRGVPSEGMICSLAELGLAKESAGIHSFTGDALQPGSDARPLLGLDDVILDLTSTANRADALSMVGIAREIAALTGVPLKLPQPTQFSIPPGKGSLSLKISEAKACPTYIGTVIEQVTIAPSPLWLQQRLQALGIRPINNVVDATNYILLEWGQPLHAFDRDRLVAVSQKKGTLQIGVRFAEAGETLKTLDGQERSLTDQALLITAHNHPVALAGVMGGEETEVFDGTRNLMLEAAYFDAAAIRRSARSQGLRTEASARYERGVNQAELELACRRALELITELAGGAIAAQAVADAGNQTSFTRSIELRLDRVNQVLGPVLVGEEIGELQPPEVERILIALGCSVSPTASERVWTVSVPPYRYRDLEREIDLIEEIARVYGYNNFCDTLPDKTEPGYLTIEQSLTRKLREVLRAVGLTEVTHYSLGKPEGDRQIVLSNPLFTEYSALRTDLMSGLIDAFQYNLEQGNGPLNAFEIGRVFWSEEDGLTEAEAVGGILGGDPTRGKWRQAGREQPITWFDAKGMLESVFTRLGITVEYQPDRRDSRLHPGRTASLWVRGTRLGTFGQLHPQLRQERGLPDEVYVFELDMDVLLDEMDQGDSLVPLYKPYSTYPPSDRDIAFFVSTQVSVAELERLITKTGRGLLESVELFDEYRGENVPEGQRSLAFRLVYRADDRTLTDEDIEPVHQKVREALVEKFRVDLRS
ncbi:phenylalanine--tRNA ligase subunit beta [Leptothermofonsia sichuanensis E412]|uniref:phenylalanine--tRNA ligase subunit beta n=1 Tax=Leptothermofonsia sichuanensis TaxID=2917832 RepID=UPI001CA73690|nr:phenylalanine--tRNA ligase subunit beta [Leptothermofonsia sichuanensis]QZZ22385.1 phenylalanine--tRNA ligase subunit beta [Leptothermofonsia sichuanensis E412]